MNMNRRNFIKGTAWMGAAAFAGGCVSDGVSSGGTDENLSVFISDLHIGGANPALGYTHARLNRVVDEILAMRPLPRRVVCFGELNCI